MTLKPSVVWMRSLASPVSGWILALVALCPFAARGTPDAAMGDPGLSALWGRNLVINGGAEADQAPPGGRSVVPISGWRVQGNLTIVPYDAPDRDYAGIRPGSPVPPDAGRNFFAGGPDNAASKATQTIDVSAAAATIDAGRVTYSFQAYLGGFEGQDDQATVTAVFCDARGTSVGQAALGPVLDADRGKRDGLLLRQTTGVLPRATRAITVELAARRTAGRYNDGYADAISLVLSRAPAGPPTAAATASTSAGEDGPAVLARFCRLLATGQTDAAGQLATDRWRHAPAGDREAAAAIARQAIAANVLGVRVLTVQPGLTHLIVALEPGGGPPALLFAELVDGQVNRLDWRSAP